MSKATAQPFNASDLMAISKALADCATNPEWDAIFSQFQLSEPDRDANLSKWKRVYNTLARQQNESRTGNCVMSLVRAALDPKRFMQRKPEYDGLRAKANELLAFRGVHLRDDGQFVKIDVARTIDEAVERADRLRAELERRQVHADILLFCRAELLKENYFHAVLEATKSVGAKIRRRTGLLGDGGDLASKAFSLGQAGTPFLAFNPLATDSDRSEQSGLMNLFIGMFGTFRNPTAHAPKIHWDVTEQDAIELLSLLSLLHRRLDAATRTNRMP